MNSNVTVIDHPLVQHKLSLLRQKDRSTSGFRTLLAEISMLLVYEVTRDLKLTYTTIETPLATMQAPSIDGKKVVLLNILRAGTGMVEGMLRILPSARVGSIGLYRDPETLGAVEYYFKLPSDMVDRGRDRGRPDARHRQQRGGRGRSREDRQSPLDQIRVPAGRARRVEQLPRRAPGRAGIHGFDR